jgi:hypothetical protein
VGPNRLTASHRWLSPDEKTIGSAHASRHHGRTSLARSPCPERPVWRGSRRRHGQRGLVRWPVRAATGGGRCARQGGRGEDPLQRWGNDNGGKLGRRSDVLRRQSTPVDGEVLGGVLQLEGEGMDQAGLKREDEENRSSPREGDCGGSSQNPVRTEGRWW